VLVVIDEWAGRGPHAATAFVPLPVDASVAAHERGAVVDLGGRTWRVSAPGARTSVERGSYALALGAAVPRPVLRLVHAIEAPARTVHAIGVGAEPLALDVVPVAGAVLRVFVDRGAGPPVAFVPCGEPA
jgi:hypothetical protein